MNVKPLFILLLLVFPFICFSQKKPAKEIDAITSSTQEVHPVISSEGDFLYFTRIGHKDSKYGEEGQEIWMSKKEGKNWINPKYVDGLNLSKVNLPIGFVNKDTLLINGIYNKSGKYWVKHGISYVVKNNLSWSKPAKLKIPGLSGSMDGKYFAGAIIPGSKYLTLTYSKQYSGKNNYIYVFERKKSSKLKFSRGKKYESKMGFDDFRRASINAEGNKMIFSALSPGLKATKEEVKQSYQAYIVERKKDEKDKWTDWEDPIKLGDSINISKNNTWGVILDPKDESYIITSNNKENANLNNYSSKVYETKINGTVTEKMTGKPIKNVEFYNDAEQISGVNYNDETGEYSMTLQQEKVYNIKAVAPFGESEVYNLDLTNDEPPSEASKNFVIFDKEAEIERKRAEIEKNKILVSGRIIDEGTNELVAITDEFKLEINNQIAEPKLNIQESTYQIRLDKGQTYKFVPTQSGYISRTVYVEVLADSETSLIRDLPLVKVVANKAINLQNILFETGKAMLIDTSFEELDKVATYLKENEGGKIKLMGHTDSRGSPKSNLKLSYLRVESVKKYLIEKGINKSRIEVEGYGHKRPIAPNNTKEGRSKNRRVEFVLVSKKSKK